jgi:hypothetical protein
VVYMAYEFVQVSECGRALRLLDEGRIDYDLLARPWSRRYGAGCGSSGA